MQGKQYLTRPALAALVCLLSGVCAARAQTPPASPLPSPTGYVNDYANVIDAPAKQRMEAILTNLNERGNVEFAVVTVQSLGGQDIFDYSLAVMRGWGLGSKEKGGLLLLFSVEERKGFIQVSRHLEGDLPDSLVGSIARKYMREPFRQGNYSEGLLNGVMAFVATLAEKRGFSVEGIDPGYAVRETPPQRPVRGPRGQPQQSSLSVCGIAFIVLIVLLLIMGSGRRRGGGGSGCLNLLLLNALFNAGSGGGRRDSGGWWGGGFGDRGGSWGGGGGGGGFGGFSGGGGDAGGGGAGFDW